MGQGIKYGDVRFGSLAAFRDERRKRPLYPRKRTFRGSVKRFCYVPEAEKEKI